MDYFRRYSYIGLISFKLVTIIHMKNQNMLRRLFSITAVFTLVSFVGAAALMAQDGGETTTGAFQVLKEKLGNGNIDEAKEICKKTSGPTASVLYEGLNKADKGAESVEKAIISYGSVQMGLLEKGLVWISLFIAIAPMLGFMGTVIGMIGAFEDIEAAGDLSPSVVAGGIKVALLTTVFGLIVAIILQIFYNYIVSKIDGIVNKMEEASIALVDIMARNNVID